MTQIRSGSSTLGAHEGEDFVCNLCGCEVMVKHWGEPRAHAEMGVFVCHCGATMQHEQPGSQEARGTGEAAFDEGDFLSQGSGVGGPGGGQTAAPKSLGDEV